MSDGGPKFDQRQHVLAVKSAQRQYRGQVPLEIGTLTFRRGAVTAVLGKSGCGKSTLLSLLAGADRLRSRHGSQERGTLCFAPSPEGDRYVWTERDVPPTTVLRRRLGMVFQSDELLDQLDVATNVALPRLLFGGRLDRQRIDAELRAVGLGDSEERQFANENPGDLSGGERARLALLRAQAHDPDVLLCDEPTSDLDPRTANELMAHLVAWCDTDRARRSVICVTHDLKAAFRWADEIWVWNSEVGRFEWFAQRLEGGWGPDAWSQATRSLGCEWLQEEPFESVGNLSKEDSPPWARFAARDLSAIPDASAGSGNPSLATLSTMAWRDFWRHPRSSGSWVLQRLLPILFIAVSFLLYSALFFAYGIEKGIQKRSETQRADPVFRFTQFRVFGTARNRVLEVLDKLRASKSAEGSAQGASKQGERTYRGFEELFVRFDVERAAYARVAARFVVEAERSPGDGEIIAAYGVALHPEGSVFKAVLKATSFSSPLEQERLQSTQLSYDGLIFSRALCNRLYGGHSAPRSVRRAIHITRVDRKLGTAVPVEHRVRLPVAGCASWLPPGVQFVATLGFGLAEWGCHACVIRTDKFYVHVNRQPLSMIDPDKVGAQLLDPLLAEARAERAGRDVRLRARLDGPLTYNGQPGFRVALFDEKGAGVRLAKEAIRRVVRDLEPAWWVTFDTKNEYTPDLKRWDADRWMAPLPDDMSVAEYERILSDAFANDIFVDTAVIARLRALDKLGTTMTGFNHFARTSLVVVLLLFLTVLLFFDSFRKVRGYGVLVALGLRPLAYLKMTIDQFIVVQGVALGAALGIMDVLLLPRLTPWLFENYIGYQIEYASLGASWGGVAGFYAAVVLGPAVVRFLILVLKQPADLIRYRV